MTQLPEAKHGTWSNYGKAIFPGLLLCLVLGTVARWLDSHVPDHLFVFNYVLIAILLGLVLRNTVTIPGLFEDGIKFATRVCLFIGIVLLGASLNLHQIFSVGASAIVMVAISICFCILICGWLAKAVKADQRWGHLVGAGIGVCGVSAVMALAPAIKAREREIVTAIGAALLTDVMVLVIVPVCGGLMAWSDTLAGFIAGVVPSNTAQCIAIGHAYSDAAGAIATIVKSARNALMPVVILLMTYIYTVRGLPVGEKVRGGLLWTRFPKFIVGLLVAAGLSTLGLLSADVVATARNLSTWFFVVCFVGIGAGIKVSDLGRQDLKVIGFGFVMTLILGLYAYLYSTLILML